MVREIAAETGIAQAYLAKVVQRLSSSGIVESKRGYRGGIRLARPPDEISILDIDEAVDGQHGPERCLLGVVECSDERSCPAHEYWMRTKADIRNRLANLTLADLAVFERSHGGKFIRRLP